MTSFKKVNSVTFKWRSAGDAYIINGSRVVHKGGGISPYRPVIGDLKMSPGQGKFFYEIVTNNDSCKLGLCTAEAFSTEQELQSVELGKQRVLSALGKASFSSNCWVFNCQTSTVEVNGNEQKKLWRLFVPVSGARFGFLVDTDEGIVLLYVNDEYQGIVFDASLGMKGKTLCPCIGLEGMDMNNKDIGTSNKSAYVTSARAFPAGLLV